MSTTVELWLGERRVEGGGAQTEKGWWEWELGEEEGGLTLRAHWASAVGTESGLRVEVEPPVERATEWEWEGTLGLAWKGHLEGGAVSAWTPVAHKLGGALRLNSYNAAFRLPFDLPAMPSPKLPALLSLHSLRLSFHRHRVAFARLPVFRRRFRSDLHALVDGRAFFLNPHVLRPALLPSSPLLLALDQPGAVGPVDLSHLFPAPAVDWARELLWHLTPSARRLHPDTAPVLGALAHSLHAPALADRVFAYITHSPDFLDLAARLVALDKARLGLFLPLLLAHHAHGLPALKPLLSHGLLPFLSTNSALLLLRHLRQPSPDADSLRRKPLAPPDLSPSGPGNFLLRADDGTTFRVARELLLLALPRLRLDGNLLHLALAPALLRHLLHLVYPPHVVPPLGDPALLELVPLLRDLGADVPIATLDAALARDLADLAPDSAVDPAFLKLAHDARLDLLLNAFLARPVHLLRPAIHQAALEDALLPRVALHAFYDLHDKLPLRPALPQDHSMDGLPSRLFDPAL